jgi:hypothetical protein
MTVYLLALFLFESWSKCLDKLLYPFQILQSVSNQLRTMWYECTKRETMGLMQWGDIASMHL